MIDTVEELQAMFCYLWKVSEDMQTLTEVQIFSLNYSDHHLIDYNAAFKV